MALLEIFPIATWLILFFWLWEIYDYHMFKHYLKLYKPVSISMESKHTSQDVSVVVLTLDTLLTSRLRAILLNDPLEVIIATTKGHISTIEHTIETAKFSTEEMNLIKVVAAPKEGKRPQMCHGIALARGKIIMTIDDHIGISHDFLRHMLPVFEDPSVGAAGPALKTSIHPSRRHGHIISPWEVAATRVVFSRTPREISLYAASKWCTVLTGVCSLFRAEIVKDPEFVEAFMNDIWHGVKQDVGEDTFITRWLQIHDWTIAVQVTPQTYATRTTKADRRFFTQMFRWERSTIRTYYQTMRHVPQVWSHRYVAYLYLCRLFRPVITTLHIASWIWSACVAPRTTIVLLVYYVVRLAASIEAFLYDYPYMRKYSWVVVGVDFFYIVQDYWCWITLGNTSWEARKKLVDE